VAGLALPRPWHRSFRAEAHGSTVARFDGGAIGDRDFAGRVGSQPPSVRALLGNGGQRKAFVENMVKFELLAQEAVRKGYDTDPQYLQEAKQRLGQLLLEKDVEAPVKAGAPNVEALKKFFEENKTALSRPERVRIAAISFAASEADGIARIAKREAAKAALAEVRRRAKDYYGFGEVAHARTEDAAARSSNGELPFATWGELASRYGEPLANAAFAMRVPGTLHDGVVETPKGFHVFKLVGREEPYEPRFDEVKDQLRQRLVGDARAEALKKYLDELWKRADVRIDEKALQAVKID
jgi:peptidyl-prolyl cis-trans isomerase C